MNRRTFLASTVSALALTPASAEVVTIAVAEAPPPGPELGEAIAFTPETPVDMARDLASRPYAPRAQVPQDWLDIDYDAYRQFWFNTDRALWRRDPVPVQVDFFHPGLYFPRGVEIDVVEDGQARHVLFDLDLFDRTDMAPDLSDGPTLDYSGFRLRGEVEQAGTFQEYAVFQGASYFRALARGQHYGLSARGLAIDTAEETGEEFPDFTHFWVEKPAPGAREVVLHALLDGPSVAGAYRMVIRHGTPTRFDVTATLFARREIAHVGLAPLTSMFLFDETNRNRFDDFRPQVHDSDGLMIHNGAGEVLWRPLANPVSLQVSAFGDDGPRGFGLMQRARSFSDFADLEAHYQDRPSLWIVPADDWGPGAVTLVEIPADKEIYDNIVAYWRPATPLAAGSEHSIAYAMEWGQEPQGLPPLARALNTRMGGRFTGGIIAAIDFAPTDAIPDDVTETEIVVTASGTAEVRGGIVQRNPDTGGPRLAFTFEPGEATSVELRAQLFVAGVPASEVWLYRWTT